MRTLHRRWAAWLGGCACACAVVGCHTPMSYDPATLPVFLREETTNRVPNVVLGDITPTQPQPDRTPSVTLATAVQACVRNNLRVRAGIEKVQLARADFVTDSTIPNPQLFADAQLLPLQRANLENQAGPPQYDAILTVPIDWWLFGKRVAAMEAARLNVDVASADFADLIRRQVVDTVVAFYDVLENRELVKLTEETVQDFQRIKDITEKQVKLGGAGSIELDRAQLALLDVQRDARLRREALAIAKAKLRPLIGRNAAEEDFEVEGSLDVNAIAPPPSLPEALALAEQHRPDLTSDRFSVTQSQAAIERERRKGKPQLSLSPGYSFQDQRRITGFRNASLFDIGVTMSLPTTDRNQGGIAKAEATFRENQLLLQADLADVRAEVEASLAAYLRVTENLQRETATSLTTAQSLRDKTEAAYKAGGRKLLDVIDAQRAYRERVQASVTNRADYWRSLYRLNASVGLRAFTPAGPPPLPPAQLPELKAPQ
jgi:cobalt-zinc-cadmium efflux system outer membrane protein